MRVGFIASFVACFASCVAPGDPSQKSSISETETLDSIVLAFQRWRRENNPAYSELLGTDLFNHQVVSYDYRVYKHRQIICQGFEAALRKVDRCQLSHDDQLTYDLLGYSLTSYIDGVEHFQDYGNLNPLNFLESSWFSILNIWNPLQNNELSFRSFFALVSSWRIQGLQIENLMRRAISLKRTYFSKSIERLMPIMDNALTTVNTSEARNRTLARCLTILRNSDAFSPSIKLDLETQMNFAVGNVILPGMLGMQQFLVNEYLPHCRKMPGVAEWDNNHLYYKAVVQSMTTLPITPEEVHELGLKEVARVRESMEKIILRNCGNRPTTTLEFSEILAGDSSSRAKNETDLLSRYQNLIDNVINPALPKVFHDIPTSPVKAAKLPFDGPATYRMINGTGVFYVNTFRVNEKPLYNMLALALHESNPGHHFQAATTSKLPLPEFRRQHEIGYKYSVPVFFPLYTAYVEGWGLYAESLGYPGYMNVLQNDSDIFGALSFEMFRASRLVVDTGIHYYNWTRERAIEYMHSNTGMELSKVSIEVDRYATWPGQALCYKIGEIAIRKLRDQAKNKLKAKFDIRDFHNAVLKNGPLPLNLLNREVLRWVDEEYRTAFNAAPKTENFMLSYYTQSVLIGLILRVVN